MYVIKNKRIITRYQEILELTDTSFCRLALSLSYIELNYTLHCTENMATINEFYTFDFMEIHVKNLPQNRP